MKGNPPVAGVTVNGSVGPAAATRVEQRQHHQSTVSESTQQSTLTTTSVVVGRSQPDAAADTVSICSSIQ